MLKRGRVQSAEPFILFRQKKNKGTSSNIIKQSVIKSGCGKKKEVRQRTLIYGGSGPYRASSHVYGGKEKRHLLHDKYLDREKNLPTGQLIYSLASIFQASTQHLYWFCGLWW